MKISDYIVEFIKSYSIDTIFGYQGGAITHLIDSIFKNKAVKYVSLYNEQGVAFAAEGYARASENIGIAMATSGPGATNLITGIGSCFFDSIPCVFITGQVNTYELKRNEKIRQEGFQEADIVKIVEPITKYAVCIKRKEDIRYILEKAFFIAKEGRPGPVLIDIPMDIQREDISIENLKSFFNSEEFLNRKKNEEDNIEEKIEKVIKLIKTSKRPVILCGGGVRLSKSSDEIQRLVNLTHIPVVTSLMGLDSLSHEDNNYVGFMGVYGTRYANLAVANSDLLLVLGSRLTSRQTSPNTKTFARDAKIVHIDIDDNELNIKIKEDISIKYDLRLFLLKLNNQLEKDNYFYDFSSWMSKIDSYKKQYPSYPTQKNDKNIDPNEIMHTISSYCPEGTVFLLDVGQNQIWAAQSLFVKNKQRVLTSGGMGAMGFALPSAIGSYYASKNKKFVVIVGDGGLQMNIQELQAIYRDKIPVKIILMNNFSLGMIRHFQDLYFDSRYYGTIEGYESPDFIKICNAYNIDTLKIENENDINKIKNLLLDDKSHLIEIVLNNHTYVIPKLEMGKPIEDQSPLVNRADFYKNMIIPPLDEN